MRTISMIAPRAIVNDVHRLPDALAAQFASRMSHVEASNTRPHVIPLLSERALRLRGNLFDRIEQERLVP
jgi:hypothetical protein